MHQYYIHFGAPHGRPVVPQHVYLYTTSSPFWFFIIFNINFNSLPRSPRGCAERRPPLGRWPASPEDHFDLLLFFNFNFNSHGDRRAPLVDDQHTYMLHHHHFDLLLFFNINFMPNREHRGDARSAASIWADDRYHTMPILIFIIL